MAAVSGGETGGSGVSLGRLLRFGAFAVAAAVLVNLVIRTVAVSVGGIGEGFAPLGMGPTVLFTAAGVTGAEVVFGLISLLSRRPVWLFRRVVLVALLISLVPDLFPSPSVREKSSVRGRRWCHLRTSAGTASRLRVQLGVRV